MKKTLAFLLTLVLLVSVMPTTIVAQELEPTGEVLAVIVDAETGDALAVVTDTEDASMAVTDSEDTLTAVVDAEDLTFSHGIQKYDDAIMATEGADDALTMTTDTDNGEDALATTEDAEPTEEPTELEDGETLEGEGDTEDAILPEADMPDGSDEEDTEALEDLELDAEGFPESKRLAVVATTTLPIVGTYLPTKLPKSGVKGTAIEVLTMAGAQSQSMTSSNGNVIRVNGDYLEFVGGGKATVKVTYQLAGAKAKTVSKAITVTSKVSGVSLNMADATLARKAKVTLRATIAPADATNKAVTWTSSNKKVATVSSKGVVTGVGGGTCTITARSKDGGYTASATITVTAIYETGLKLSKSSLSLNKGKSAQLKATLTPKTTDFKAVTWTSDNPAVATVSAKGKVTAGTQTGTCTITATSVNGIVARCTVTTMGQRVKSVKMGKTASTQYTGNTVKLSVTVNPAGADNKSINWTSSNSTVATVDAYGVVSFLKSGKVTIKATAADGSRKAASKKFTVKQAAVPKPTTAPTPAPTPVGTPEPTATYLDFAFTTALSRGIDSVRYEKGLSSIHLLLSWESSLGASTWAAQLAVTKSTGHDPNFHGDVEAIVYGYTDGERAGKAIASEFGSVLSELVAINISAAVYDGYYVAVVRGIKKSSIKGLATPRGAEYCAEVLRGINSVREEQGLPPITVIDPDLEAGAQTWAEFTAELKSTGHDPQRNGYESCVYDKSSGGYSVGRVAAIHFGDNLEKISSMGIGAAVYDGYCVLVVRGL